MYNKKNRPARGRQAGDKRLTEVALLQMKTEVKRIQVFTARLRYQLRRREAAAVLPDIL